MAQIENRIIANGENTPVDQTFSVVQPQQGVSPAKWLLRNSGSYASFAEITELLARKSTSERVTIKIRVPYLNEDGSRRAQNMFTCQFILDDNATVAERADLLAYASNVLSSAVTAASVKNSEPTH